MGPHLSWIRRMLSAAVMAAWWVEIHSFLCSQTTTFAPPCYGDVLCWHSQFLTWIGPRFSWIHYKTLCIFLRVYQKIDIFSSVCIHNISEILTTKYLQNTRTRLDNLDRDTKQAGDVSQVQRVSSKIPLDIHLS